MNILDIIAKKRDKMELSKEEIEFFIKEYTENKIEDYQAAALVMAIYINGMTDDELANLTLAMAYSGAILDLSDISLNVVDKHSTGGVGDKVTLILMPVIASIGIPVAKMSGRGLGITGGTIDKLESIPGYNTSISVQEFIENVKKIGISLMGQTLDLAPADKKIYALRDTIACTASMPLIASSIMSKKIAAGTDKIVLEVTYGSGAFMKNRDEAEKLGNMMQKIGKLVNKEVVCVLTSMEEPLGFAVGNSLEIIETVEALKNNMADDVRKVVLELGANIIKLAGKGNDLEENKKMVIANIENGKAFDKFVELIEIQGGNIEYIKDINRFEKAKYILPVVSEKEGTVKELNAGEVGKLAMLLGAGRQRKTDIIDNSVGIVLSKKVGDLVKECEILAFIHANDEQQALETVKKLKNVYVIE